jgi:hypothetical protein
MAPMKIIDDITSSILTRAKYYEAVDNGADPASAMKQADDFAAKVITDRSKGALPTVFNKKNPVARLFTMFQVEVNNQMSFLFKDIPAMAKQNGKMWLASTLMKFMVGSWIFNWIYERLTGRKAAIDPIGTVIDVAKNAGDSKKLLSTLGEDIGGQVPFVGGVLFNGGRLPMNAALPDVTALFKGETTIGKELLKPVTYILPPVGGGQIRKTIEGLAAYSKGRSEANGKMRYPIPKTLPNLLKTAVFGQYSTPEAREYFNQGRSPLSEDQTAKIDSMVDAGIDMETAYNLFIALRKYSKKAQKQLIIDHYDGLSKRQKEKFKEIYFKEKAGASK